MLHQDTACSRVNTNFNFPVQLQTSDMLLLSEICDQVEHLLCHCPYLWQIWVVQAILKNNKDVASITATDSGKTLTFWVSKMLILWPKLGSMPFP